LLYGRPVLGVHGHQIRSLVIERYGTDAPEAKLVYTRRTGALLWPKRGSNKAHLK